MRILAVAALALSVAGASFAQRSNYGSGSGFGNVIYPGTGRPPANPNVTGFGNIIFPGSGGAPRTPFSITNPGFAQGFANTVSGRVPYGGGRGGGQGNRSRGPIYVPYAYPVYGGGYDAYAQPQQQPNVTVIYPAPQPPVVINQNFGGAPAAPVEALPAYGDTEIKVYKAPARSEEETASAAAQASQPYYLIAFKDHSIYSAVAYWIDGDTLHYFTSGNNHNQVSMALVDKELTERLNKERSVDVRMPK